jgi:predicted ribosomally synthesized peptide with SipW-like signal peptide
MRVRAVLAAGTALGLTVGATVASWSDAEHGVGGFAASRFVVQSNANGAGWTESPTAPGTAVALSSTGMFPGDGGRFVQVLLRTTAGSVAGTAALQGATLGGADAATLGPALEYRVVRSTATCDATAFSGSPVYLVGSASVWRPLTTGQEAGAVPLAAGTPTAPGATTGLCFEVRVQPAAPASLANRTATATWRIGSTSS